MVILKISINDFTSTKKVINNYVILKTEHSVSQQIFKKEGNLHHESNKKSEFMI